MGTKVIAAVVFIIELASAGAYAQSVVDIMGAPVSIQVLAQSPADTVTDLQVICLFQSVPANALHGSLAETNDKLNGLLDRIRKPDLFRGELGETLLIAPKDGLSAKRLLVIGLGDSENFSPGRMQLVGEVLYSEAAGLGVAHPFFAPTILDGGVSKFATGEVAEQVIRGFLRGAAIDKLLKNAQASTAGVTALTYLAGAKNVDGTRAGIQKAISASRP